MNIQSSPALSFNEIAELYDEVRPQYPSVLVDDIVETSELPQAARILEIGCGTGQATVPFAKKGYSMLCLEPGTELRRIAEARLTSFQNVRVETARFEDWSGQTGFDLIISAQAFHWIPPEIGYPKCADLLKDGGWIAMFWNMIENDDTAIFQDLNELYKSVAPELTDHIDKTTEARERGLQEGVDEINACGLFGPVTVRRYRWSETYTAERYLKLLNTFSDHRALSASTKAELFHEVMEIITRYGGTIPKPYISVLYLAKKRERI